MTTGTVGVTPFTVSRALGQAGSSGSAAIIAALGFTPAATNLSAIPVGSVTAPGGVFAGDSGSGLYQPSGSGTFGIAAGSTSVFTASASAAQILVPLTNQLAININPSSPATGTNRNPIVLGASAVTGPNRAFIETNAQMVDVGGGNYQSAVPMQINQYGGNGQHFEPLLFFMSRGAMGGPGVASQANDVIALIQATADDGRGAAFGNNVAVNLEASVSPLFSVATGIIPGRYRIKTADGTGTVNLVATFDADFSTTLEGTLTVKDKLTLQKAGQILPTFLNATQIATNDNVGSILFNALGSTGAQEGFASIFGGSGASVTHGSVLGVLQLRVAQGASGALASGLTVTGSASAVGFIQLTSPGTPTILSGTAIPAGGTAGAGYKFSTTANFGVFFGSGAPTLTAAQGSLYLRSDGSSTSTRMYVNNSSGSGTTWTAVTTAA